MGCWPLPCLVWRLSTCACAESRPAAVPATDSVAHSRVRAAAVEQPLLPSRSHLRPLLPSGFPASCVLCDLPAGGLPVAAVPAMYVLLCPRVCVLLCGCVLTVCCWVSMSGEGTAYSRPSQLSFGYVQEVCCSVSADGPHWAMCRRCVAVHQLMALSCTHAW